MPVEMTYFQTAPHDKHIQLEWATVGELDNDGFEVQRSTDRFSFAKIGWVGGCGTSGLEQSYRFTDDRVQPNINYCYRLNQMDADGTEEFTPLRQALVEDANIFQAGELSPDPASNGHGFGMFRLHVPEAGEVAMQVFDSRGGLVNELTKQAPEGSSMLSVPVGDLANGQYFVKLQFGREVLYRKLVVE